MNRRSVLSIILVAALAACSQGPGATPSAAGLEPNTPAAPPGKTTSKCISHCAYVASRVYALTPTLESDGKTWEPFQGISSYAATDDGVATPLASTAGLAYGSAAFDGSSHDQLFRDPAGTFWYIGAVNGTNKVINCNWNGVTGGQCIPTYNWPTQGITNPISMAVDPTGRLAVLNADESVAVFPANATSSSVPVMLYTRFSVIGNDDPVRVGFDTARRLWISTTVAPNSHGMLAGYNIGASGEQAPNMTIALSTAPIGGCPFAFNKLNQFWAACTDSSGYGHLYNINATTGTLTSRTDYPNAPFSSQIVEIATDDEYVYVSDRLEQSVFIYSNQTSNGPNGLIGSIHYQGGIALQ